jgi:aldehyde dehydrogenase (NAD+)
MHNNTQNKIVSLIENQRAFFLSGETKKYEWRVGQLKTLRRAVAAYEPAITDAIAADFGKHPTETFMSEIVHVYGEIHCARRSLREWMASKRVPSPFAYFPARSAVVPEPYGTVLCVSPWNYPFSLLFIPLVGALAAGNTVVLKPSEISSHTAGVCTQMIAEWFDPRCVAAVTGDASVSEHLVAQPFDHIFFTGSKRVGTEILHSAAERGIPVTLELGGKSPCVVFGDCAIDMAAKRIVWGKFFNAGQSCVAPDYLVIETRWKEKFLAAARKYIARFYGDNPKQSPSYARIISERHFDRLAGMLDDSGTIEIGGKTDRSDRYIEPTVVSIDHYGAALMEEEIFGPILPILAFDSLTEAIETIRSFPDPLILYIFSHDNTVQNTIMSQCRSGAVNINDTLSYFTSTALPFGGRGHGGSGKSHGYASFAAFSHFRGIMRHSLRIDDPLKYPPYRPLSALRKKLYEWLLRP